MEPDIKTKRAEIVRAVKRELLILQNDFTANPSAANYSAVTQVMVALQSATFGNDGYIARIHSLHPVRWVETLVAEV